MFARPQPDEYAPIFVRHVHRIPEGSNILTILSSQPDELRTLLQSVSDEHASLRPEPSEWSIKEVVGHVIDTDRIFAYRILRCARGDTTPLVGYDPTAYVETAHFNTRNLSDLVDVFTFYRRADAVWFNQFTEEEIMRRGTVIDHPVSVRGLLFTMAGHVMHHIESLKTTYKVGSG